MATISEHLHDKPFQVAVSRDPKLPMHKWDHVGTVWACSSRSAAYAFRESKNLPGSIVRAVGTAYEFPDGQFVQVGFGSACTPGERSPKVPPEMSDANRDGDDEAEKFSGEPT